MFPSVTFYWLFPCAFPKDLCGGALRRGLEGGGCWKCVGREGMGLCLLADGQCDQPKGKLRAMELSGFSPCHGRISLLWSAARPQPTQFGSDLAAGAATEQSGFAAALWFAKISFGHLGFLPLLLQQSASVCCYRCCYRSASRADENLETWGSSVGGRCL